MRWKPLKLWEQGGDEWTPQINFIQGIKSMCGAGDPALKNGLGIHAYAFTASMGNEVFYSADGDFLIVPQQGTLYVTTEFGRMVVAPLEICVI